MPDIRAFVPAIILLAGCVGMLRTRAQVAVPLSTPIQSLLAEWEGYRVQDQKVSDEERAVAGMSDYVARIYWKDSIPAFTTLVSYYDKQTQGRSIHSPQNCLPGAGWEVMTTGRRTIVVDGQRHVVNVNTLKNGALTAVVWYWYQGRGRIVASEYAVKWNLLRDAALEGHTEEALVRVVVPLLPSATGNPATTASAHADSLGQRVAVRLAHEVQRILPGPAQLPRAD